MTTLADFQSKIRLFKIISRETIENYAKGLSIAIQQSVGSKTPVDTGSAKDSWNVSAPSADLNFKDRDAGYSNPFGPPAGSVSLEGFRLGQTIHISNNVKYIRALNAGHSSQAPAGFVERTVAEVLAGLLR